MRCGRGSVLVCSSRRLCSGGASRRKPAFGKNCVPKGKLSPGCRWCRSSARRRVVRSSSLFSSAQDAPG
eukprot:128386-Lingulodinium_polyedra.AAC.1